MRVSGHRLKLVVNRRADALQVSGAGENDRLANPDPVNPAVRLMSDLIVWLDVNVYGNSHQVFPSNSAASQRARASATASFILR